MVSHLYQTFGQNFYHFVFEELSRLVLVVDLLKSDPEIRVLMHKPNFAGYFLSLMGISLDRIEGYESNVVYFADMLYVTRPTPCAMPARENLQELHRLLVKQDLPSQHRKDIVLIVRHGIRELHNSKDLELALRTRYGSDRVVVFGGGVSAENSGAKSREQTREVFMRAGLVCNTHIVNR